MDVLKSNATPTLVATNALPRCRPPTWLMGVLLMLVTILVYWPATNNDFVNYDDDAYVTGNSHVQSGLTLGSMEWALLHPVSCNWQPVTMWSHMLDCQVFGLHPWGHHLTNVLLHAINAMLVFLLLQQMTGAKWRSLFVGALFSVHPLCVESVGWVAERKDVLSGCFGLLTLLAYQRYVRVQRLKPGSGPTSPASRSTHHASLYYVLAVFLFALGLMSKPTLVTWPFVMLLLDYWPLGRSAEWGVRSTPSGRGGGREVLTGWIWLVVEKVPFFALAAADSVITLAVQTSGGSVVAAGHLPFGVRSANALISYCRHLGKLFWPTDLAVFYPYAAQWRLGQVLLAGGLLLGISAMLWVQRRRVPFLLVGWLWFVGMLVPMIGLVQTGGQAMADRHTYLPSLGVLILSVWGACELARRWRYRFIALSVAGSAAVILCVWLTRQQLGYWKNSETLFRHALDVTGPNWVAYNNLGAALASKGQTNAALRVFEAALRLDPNFAAAHYSLGTALIEMGRIDEAIGQLQQAIRLDPNDAGAHQNLGAALLRKGQIDEAINQYEAAIRLKADNPDAFYNLGVALDKKGRTDEAISRYRDTIRLKPNDVLARNALGVALLKKGQIDEAISEQQEAIRLKPEDAYSHYQLGNALAMKGRIDEAINQFQEALRLKPEDAAAQNDLGNALTREGRLDEAISHLREAARLKPDETETHYNLANALFRKGRIDEAILQYQEALRLKPEDPDAHNNCGVALWRKGRTKEAITQFQEALQLRPDYADARRNLDALRAAQARSSKPPSATPR